MINLPGIVELVLQWLTLTCMLVGLIGLIFPIFPGIFIIWFASLVYAVLESLAGKMVFWDWLFFGIITVLMITGSFIDNIIIMKKLRETGTPWKSIAIGYTAGLISSIFLTPIAAIFITPLGLYAAEYRRLKDKKQAIASVKAWLIGTGWTLIVLWAIGLMMIFLWLLWIWK